MCRRGRGIRPSCFPVGLCAIDGLRAQPWRNRLHSAGGGFRCCIYRLQGQASRRLRLTSRHLGLPPRSLGFPTGTARLRSCTFRGEARIPRLGRSRSGRGTKARHLLLVISRSSQSLGDRKVGLFLCALRCICCHLKARHQALQHGLEVTTTPLQGFKEAVAAADALLSVAKRRHHSASNSANSGMLRGPTLAALLEVCKACGQQSVGLLGFLRAAGELADLPPQMIAELHNLRAQAALPRHVSCLGNPQQRVLHMAILQGSRALLEGPIHFVDTDGTQLPLGNVLERALFPHRSEHRLLRRGKLVMHVAGQVPQLLLLPVEA
mmetsp:Transcript_75008/g.165925  ORF Transcript_75008/g.165925 Transcript_75008/m.165925 type:complete len:323 (+) Transcript_75008:1235-2203(+)